MSDYTPTTDEVRQSYVTDDHDRHMVLDPSAEFDRWLAAERARIWDEGWDTRVTEDFKQAADRTHPITRANPYRKEENR